MKDEEMALDKCLCSAKKACANAEWVADASQANSILLKKF
jgi:hypothetical protein